MNVIMNIINNRSPRITFRAFDLTLSSITWTIYTHNKANKPKTKPKTKLTTQTGILNTPECRGYNYRLALVERQIIPVGKALSKHSMNTLSNRRYLITHSTMQGLCLDNNKHRQQ